MIKQFFKDSVVYSLPNVFSKMIAFFMLPLYTIFLSPSDFGIVDLIALFCVIIGYFFTVCISQGVARYITELSDNEKKVYISTAFTFVLLMTIIFIVICTFLSKYLSRILLDDKEKYKILILGICANASLYLNDLTTIVLRFERKRNHVLLSSLLKVFIQAVVVVVCFFIFKMKIESLFLGILISSILVTLYSILVNINNYRFNINILILKKLLSFSWPFVFSSVGVFFILYIDRICINYYLTLNEVGLYGIAARFASISAFIISGLSLSLNPLIYEKYKEKGTASRIWVLFRFYLEISFLLILATSFFSKEIVLFFSSELYLPAHNIIPLLMAVNFLGAGYMFFPGLAIAKKTKEISLINIFSAIINWVLNIIFINVLGLIGVAIASVISTLFNLIIQFVFSHKYYKLPFNYLHIIVPSFLFILFITVLFFNLTFVIKIIIIFFLYLLYALSFIFYRKDKLIIKLSNNNSREE